MSSYTPFGAGTITVKVGAGTAIDYSGEVLGGAVSHGYSDVGDTRTMLNGDKRGAQQSRNVDGIKLSTEADLTLGGLYDLCQKNDLKVATVTFTPNTLGGASWAGDVVLQLPEEIGSDEWASPITAEYTWQTRDGFNFTPATAGVRSDLEDF